MDDGFIKIINTTYKVLDFFPENEPLKNKAKEKVLSVLDNLTLISNAEGWASLQKEKASVQLLNDIEILETYLRLAKYQGWIDGVNLLILTKEYNQIKNNINVSTRFIENRMKLMSIDSEKEKKYDNKKDKKEISKIENNEIKKSKDYSDRQNKILDILTSKEKAQVSDIIKEIPDITKRTIRRDLDNLLKRGDIVRVGEFNQVFYQKTGRLSY